MKVVPGAAGAIAPGATAPDDWYFSTSALVILPFSPVPLMFLSGMPFSKANVLAAGEAKIRSLSRTVSNGFPLDSG